MHEIAICDDDTLYCDSIKKMLMHDFKISSYNNRLDLLKSLHTKRYPLILLDIQMKYPKEGLQMIPKIKELCPKARICILTGHLKFQYLQEALRIKVDDFFEKGTSAEELKKRIKSLLSQSKPLFSTRDSSHFFSHSVAVQELTKRIKKARNSGFDVLIDGESGTGKERIANSLKRKNEAWVAIDAANIPETMAESLLFGHERGAFTGAAHLQVGFLERAHHGTLFIDEISNLPLSNQQKLLRALEERKILRLGGTKEIKTEFRLIAATNKDLERLCEKGEFLWDLYQRLNVLKLHATPLRERIEDLDLLIKQILSDLKKKLVFSQEALETLRTYSWPGNIRELINTLKILVTFSDSPLIRREGLPRHLFERNNAPNNPFKTLNYSVKQFEKELLRKSFHKNKGKINQMADELKIDRSNLYRKLRNYQINALP